MKLLPFSTPYHLPLFTHLSPPHAILQPRRSHTTQGCGQVLVLLKVTPFPFCPVSVCPQPSPVSFQEPDVHTTSLVCSSRKRKKKMKLVWHCNACPCPYHLAETPPCSKCNSCFSCSPSKPTVSITVYVSDPMVPCPIPACLSSNAVCSLFFTFWELRR